MKRYRKKDKKNEVLDTVLKFCATSLILFTIVVLVIFAITGNEPSTLVACFFSAFSLEGGLCAFIWRAKRKDKVTNEGRNICEDSSVSDIDTGYDIDILPDPLDQDEGR